jgi:uncharacterized protein GlcG (DUF336 family)
MPIIQTCHSQIRHSAIMLSREIDRWSSIALSFLAARPAAVNTTPVSVALLLGGGQPLMVAGDVIGAICVAGAGGAPNDDRCGLNAIARVLPASTPRP